jgi:hypothetical protein
MIKDIKNKKMMKVYDDKINEISDKGLPLTTNGLKIPRDPTLSRYIANYSINVPKK